MNYSIHHQRSLERFEEMVDSWFAPIPPLLIKNLKTTSFEDIASWLNDLKEIGEYVNVDLIEGGLDKLDLIKRKGNCILVSRFDGINQTYIKIDPKAGFIHLDLEPAKNYFLLSAKAGQSFNGLPRGDHEICIEQNGTFYPLRKEKEFGPYCNTVVNVYKENTLVLFHPHGSIYGNEEMKYALFKGFNKLHE